MTPDGVSRWVKGAVVDERFEILDLAGAGGMGSVYRARDLASGAVVALKVLRDASATGAARLAREGHVLSELDHPDIVRCIALGELPSGAPFLALEWCDGESLAQRLARKALSIEQSVTLARRTAAALQAAHARGVVHRDLKPGNLLLIGGDPGRVKVLDFGLAHFLSQGGRSLTVSGVVLGTPGYLAPEQARGLRNIDTRADVFALGCVLYRCIAGRPPFEAEEALGVLLKVVLEDPPRLSALRSDVPEELDALVARMLAKAPSDRPNDAGEVLRELEQVGVSAGLQPPSLRTGAPSLTRNERRVFCLILARDASAPAPDSSATPGLACRREETLVTGDLEAARRMTEVARHAGGKLDALADGSLLMTFTGSETATDLAASAARGALTLRASMPEAAIVLVTGHAVVADSVPVGDVVEHAVRMLRRAARAAPSDSILIDDVTAGLLDPRFSVVVGALGRELVGERLVEEAARTLLGKPAPFVGRDRDVERIEAIFDESMEEGVAHAVLLTGPAGIGKSRMRHELLSRVRRRREQVEIWNARGDPMSAGAPLGLIAQLVRDAAGVRDGEPIGVRRERLLSRVSRQVPPGRVQRVAEFLGELSGVQFPQSVQLAAARHDAALMSDQLLQAWLDFLDAETASGPLLVVLEDLHWGDRPTVRFIDAALREFSGRPLVVLAMARPDVHKAFPRLWADRSLHEQRLAELSKRASERLVRCALGDDADADLVARLVTRGSGHAFYLEELVRAVAERREGELPGTVLAMVQTRLETLELDARRVLRAASVFGGAFWREGVAALLSGVSAETIAHAVDQLVARETLTRQRTSRIVDQDELTFRHPLVHEAAYAMLTEEDRILGHRLAAQWLERVGEVEPLVLAEHYQKGGDSARAAAWHRRAVEASLGANDLDAAISRAERAVECASLVEGDDPELTGGLRRLEAEARRWRGDLAAAERVGLEAMRALRPGSELWYEAATEVALASGQLTHHDVLRSVAEVLRDTAPDAGARDALVITASHVAFQIFFAGADAHFRDLVALIESTSAQLGALPPLVSARVHEVRATAALTTGDAGGYLEHMALVARDFERAGDVRNLCWARINLAHAHLEVGAWADAEPILRASVRDATALGIREAIAAAYNNLGLALAHLGALDEARQAELEAVARFRETGNRRLEGGSRIYLSLVHRLRGELEDAEREARAAAELLAVAPPLQPHALARLAEALLAAGRIDEAMEAVDRALAAATALERLEEGEAALGLVRAEVLYAAGRIDEARLAIAAARARLLARAANIESAERRRCFLEGIPENARTLALAADWISDSG